MVIIFNIVFIDVEHDIRQLTIRMIVFDMELRFSLEKFPRRLEDYGIVIKINPN